MIIDYSKFKKIFFHYTTLKECITQAINQLTNVNSIFLSDSLINKIYLKKSEKLCISNYQNDDQNLLVIK